MFGFKLSMLMDWRLGAMKAANSQGFFCLTQGRNV